MTDTKFTPGPWVVSITEYEGRTRRYEVMQAGWSRVICNVHKSGKANGYRYTVPAEANAALIAAAPSMRDAIEVVLNIIDTAKTLDDAKNAIPFLLDAMHLADGKL